MGAMFGNPNQNGGARAPVCKGGEVHKFCAESAMSVIVSGVGATSSLDSGSNLVFMEYGFSIGALKT